MAKGLTSKQEEILKFIQEYVDKEGYPPSIREIGKVFDIGSLRGVTVHLDALERKGYISRSNLPRSIKVVHPEYMNTNRVAMLPLMGDIAAGSPIYVDGTAEDMIPVPVHMIGNANDAFVLRVKGDSMIGDGIMPYDMVVVKPTQNAKQNDLVAVMIEDQATVKRINFTKNGVLLMASNPAYEPIPVDHENSRVIGKIIGLLREYSA
jgi:repressor LexA